MNLGPNSIAAAIQFDVIATSLNVASGCTLALVSDEDNIGVRVIEKCFSIVHDSATGAHPATEDHDGRDLAVVQVIEGRFAIVVISGRGYVLKHKRLVIKSKHLVGFGVPMGLQAVVDFRELLGKR